MSADVSPQPAKRRRRWLAWLGLVLGVTVLAALSYSAGVAAVENALAAAGPAIFVLVGFHVFQLGPNALGWALIFPPGTRPRWSRLFAAQWAGQSVNVLLPVANVGGDVVRARLIAADPNGVPVATAMASVIADKTVQAIVAVALLALGLALLAGQSADTSLLGGTALTLVLLAAGVAGFIRVQRSRGVSGLVARLTSAREGAMDRLREGTRAVESGLADIYARPGRLALSVTIRVLGAVALCLEVWAAAALMGIDLSLLDAVTLRVVGFAVRSAAFFVWGGLGVQEATYVAVGALYGLPPADLLAVSLATRVREITVAVPGVIYWLTREGTRVNKRHMTDTGGLASHSTTPAESGRRPTDT